LTNDTTAPKKIKKYFSKIENKVNECFLVATAARKQGKDPVDEVETSITKNMVERVIKLISKKIPKIDDKKVIEKISELEKKYSPQDWRVGFDIAKEISLNKLIKFDNEKDAVEAGIRVGFSYLTGGIVAAPLEGLLDVEIKEKNKTKHLKLIFAGPIRGAGGTASAVSVVLANCIRQALGFSKYKAEKNEILRIITEIYDYNEKI
jgi:DNA polymerase II large subunit